MRLLTFLLFILLGATVKADWKPTDGRLTSWIPGQTIGVLGGIPTTRTNWATVTTSIPGTNIVMATTNADNTPALNAIFTYAASNGVAYVPDGVYVFTNGAGVATDTSFGKPWVNNFTIRGQSTNVVFSIDPPTNVTMAAFISLGHTWWAATGFKAGTGGAFFTNNAPAGTFSVTLSNTPADVVLGGRIWFDQTNDEAVVTAHGNAYGTNVATAYDRPQTGTRSQHHDAIVTNISGTTFKFTPPLPCGFFTNRGAFAIGPSFTRSSQMYGVGVGLENITFRINTNRTISKVVYFNGTHNSWMSNCIIPYVKVTGIYGLAASMCEIRHCWVGGALSATVGQGYAVDWRASTGLWIEDCVIPRPYIPIISGAQSMQVVSYNHIIDVITQGGGGVQGGWINMAHGGHSHYGILEGNIGGRFHADFNHGSSGPFTVFRNAYGLTNDALSTANRSSIRMDRFSLSNVVACSILGSTNQGAWYYELTNSGYSNNSNNVWQLGFPAIGSNAYDTNAPGANETRFDTNVAFTLFRHGNYDYATYTTNWASGNTNRTFEASLIYTNGPPSWWNTNNFPWPPIGTDRSPMIGYTPARAWYEGRTNSPYLSASASTSTEDPDEFIRRVFFFLPTIFLRNYFDIRWNP